KDNLVAALDDWVLSKRTEQLPGQEKLLDVARQADPDPWRNRLRDALQSGNTQALWDLAGEKEVPAQPPATALLLASEFRRQGHVARAVEVLEPARRAHPNDFWLNHDLAFFLTKLQPARTDDAVGLYRVALTIRPDSPGVHLNLGNALSSLGKRTEAVEE